jgi:hypothetical protein
MFRPLFVAAALASLGAGSLSAQETPLLTVRTFTLRNLRPEDAAKLISPYVTSRDGGVFEAGSIRALTVRETPQVLARIDSLLRVHDRERQALTLRFQLIAAMDTGSASTDPALGSIDSSLRGLLRFKSYALLGEGTTTTAEQQDFALTVAAGPQQFGIHGWIDQVNAGSTPATAGIKLTLSDNGQLNVMPRPRPTDLFTTGLTIPLGQSVVLGSAASTMASNRTLILVVRPEASSLRAR